MGLPTPSALQGYESEEGEEASRAAPGTYEYEEGGEYEEDAEEGSEEGEDDEGEVADEGQENGLGEEEEEEEDEDEEEEEDEDEDEEEEEDGEEQPDESQVPAGQSVNSTTQKPLTSRQRREQEKIARRIERERKKAAKEQEKAERMAKRERERLERIAKKEHESQEFQRVKQERILKASSRPSSGKTRASGSHSSAAPLRKIRIDPRIETVRRLITSTPTGELYLQNTIDPRVAEADPNARWCETKTYKGVTYLVEEDELILPNDPKGDLKVTPEGVILGDRQYKIPTFTSKARANPNKHFVLSIDAARAAGYRDSLYFFRRNPLIQKLPCTQDEKDALIAAGFLSGNLKSRAVTMCSARNAFKVMGARFLKGGRHVIDDYYEDAAFASGATVGEPAIADGLDPQDRPTVSTTDAPGQEATSASNSNALAGQEPVALKPTQSAFRLALNHPNPAATASGSSNIKSNFAGDGRPPFGFVMTDPKEKKRRPAPNLTSKNWMLQYCRAISEMNRHLRTMRRERLKPFRNFGSAAENGSVTCGSDCAPTLVDGEAVEPHPAGMEWRDVEVDMRLNTEGRIVESGEESDTKTDDEEEERSETEASTPVPPPSNPGPSFSRITNTLPADSIITVYGLENASRTTETSHLHERASTHLGVAAGGGHSRAHSPSQNRAGARSPYKKTPKPAAKKPKNQWWTTTVKVLELRPKQPVMGLLDVHSGLPFVRQDTQPRVCFTEKLDDVPSFELGRQKRKRGPATGDGTKVNGDAGSVGGLIDLHGQQANKLSKMSLVTVETVMTDRLCSPRPPLIPGMWNFRPDE